MTTQTGSGDFEPDFRCTQKILLAAKKALGELPDSPVRTFAELLQEDDATYVDAVVQRQPQFPASAMLVVATLLKRNMHLRSLCLNYNRLNDECVALLAGGVGGNGSVTSLYLVGNAFKIVGTRALAKAIEHTSSLTHLDLRQNAIAEFGGSALGVSCAKNRSLRTLVLRVAHLPVQELTGHVGVETLSLSALKIGDVDAFFIGSAIMSNRETARLLLDENDITDIGCRAIAKGLTGHKSIKEVDFRRDAAGEKAFEGLADMLQAHSQSVEELLFADIPVTSACMTRFAKGILGNRVLRSLELVDCGITDAECSLLADGLLGNKGLYRLILSDNRIGDVGCERLALVLRVHGFMRELLLDRNYVGRAGCIAIGAALRLNRALEILDLCDNNVMDSGLEGLVDGLRINRVLKEIKARNNFVTSPTASVEVACANGVLTVLALDGNWLNPALCDSLSVLLKRLKRRGAVCDVSIGAQRYVSPPDTRSAFARACGCGRRPVAPAEAYLEGKLLELPDEDAPPPAAGSAAAATVEARPTMVWSDGKMRAAE